mmetsp:Transcript_1891/g.2165  ORF Transcript_1891/g.2165 Transcript_1891/m.2165 type:complete len:507 (+) Transcript_1891:213-1733(+)|eukprot:CAMPEP_0184022794 /NCGR_PEP_ID=MMETSP0954-20121128/10869_1 /TAXON_ID=627963 /ORGANISM="Aplanochytrium sp, Strain PBS07" /LENGTH=506 /DNA_ID=CAMNT_0026305339 /DNA_START=204 /DNA_END=1724 /DNA_ORIENTATION=-
MSSQSSRNLEKVSSGGGDMNKRWEWGKRKVDRDFSGSLNNTVHANQRMSQYRSEPAPSLGAGLYKEAVNASGPSRTTKLSPAIANLPVPLTKNQVPDRRSAVDRVASKPRHWKAEEDELLRAAVAHFGNRHWKKIAERVPGRNHTQCLQRWSKVLQPGLKKGQWSKEEDETLIETAKKQLEKCVRENREKKLNWGQICKSIKGRTAKQCRERWVNNLDPDIRKGQWTPEEDQKIMELHAHFPKKWAMISKNLPGRTENSVKIRYKTLARAAKTANEKKKTPVKPKRTPASRRPVQAPHSHENVGSVPVAQGSSSEMPVAYSYYDYEHQAEAAGPIPSEGQKPESMRSIYDSFKKTQSNVPAGSANNMELLKFMNSFRLGSDEPMEMPSTLPNENANHIAASEHYYLNSLNFPANTGSQKRLSERSVNGKSTWGQGSTQSFDPFTYLSGRKLSGRDATGSNNSLQSSLKFPVFGYPSMGNGSRSSIGARQTDRSTELDFEAYDFTIQ